MLCGGEVRNHTYSHYIVSWVSCTHVTVKLHWVNLLDRGATKGIGGADFWVCVVGSRDMDLESISGPSALLFFLKFFGIFETEFHYAV